MKIKTGFTPGPWKTIKDSIGFSVADYIEAPCEYEDGRVMHVRLGEKEYAWSTKESEANARLIAAAPEMFQAFVDLYFEDPLFTLEKVRKLIEKVTGKTIEELEKEK